MQFFPRAKLSSRGVPNQKHRLVFFSNAAQLGPHFANPFGITPTWFIDIITVSIRSHWPRQSYPLLLTT